MNYPNNSACGCGHASGSMSKVAEIYHHLSESGAPLAMAYVPYQSWKPADDLCRSLNAGTIFPALRKPFCGKGGKCW